MTQRGTGGRPSGQTTRATILGTAVDLASLQGLQQLSLARLAAAVNSSKSGLFAHFGSKEELQLATIEKAWGIFEDQVLSDPEGERADDAALRTLLERWLAFSRAQGVSGWMPVCASGGGIFDPVWAGQRCARERRCEPDPCP